MEIKSVKFISASAALSSMPAPELPEYAFVGRSNVGKSSLINAVSKRKDLAHTSSTPGKTRTINHYLVDETWYLADLPGYGFARVAKTERDKFSNLIQEYVLGRKNLMTVFVLVDSRIPPQKADLEFIEFLGANAVPLVIVFTKMDKLNQSELARNLKAFEKAMSETWEDLPRMFRTSAETGMGISVLLDYIEETNGLF